MSLLPHEEIGMEVHRDVDQFFRIDEGEGKLVIEGGGEHELKNGTSILVKAGTRHNVVNTSGNTSLKLYTVYAPPNHPPDRIQKTKAEAVDAEEKEKRL
jgi:mannose-6-phosphate isomerase-like protein (cupin superfamily)